MGCSTAISILAIRQIFLLRLEERVERSLIQEVGEFQQLRHGLNPMTGEPFGDDIAALFDIVLSRNIPDENEILLTLLDGRFYKASDENLPASLDPNSRLVQTWAQLTQSQQGQVETAMGNVFYRVEPVNVRGETRGVFVVVHPIVYSLDETNAAILTIAQVTLTVLAVASIMSWLAAGRALLPLRFLTEMARSITGSDLTRRIPVKGSDEIAELSKTFNEMLDRLQATFVSQRNFINDAGHELRTPITIVRGHLELMGSDPQEQGETLDLVFDELDRMNRFVNDLLLLAKAEQPDFLNVAPVDTDLITLEFFAKAKALAERDWRIVIENPGCVVVDRQRLTQAVMNLAHNATHHTRREDTIEIGSSLTATDARFWVRDTGEGIPLAEQERIFERFARGAKNRRSEGAGLGLAIVSAIAEAHGGRIELSSQVAIGSTFAIILPVVTLQAGLESVSGI
ncbi:HAMP domain-containing protein [Oculatella sp. LEGE 06141]|nr:HAMP domain-containing protein [Oculatella sp. LEGE 06141]